MGHSLIMTLHLYVECRKHGTVAAERLRGHPGYVASAVLLVLYL